MTAVTYIKRYNEDGFWSESNDQYSGNPPMIAALDNASWISVAVFDGARTFEGVTPDLELHCSRLMESAKRLRVNPPVDVETVVGICRQAIARFPKDALLYVRPEFWAAEGIVLADPNKINFAVVVHEIPWAGDTFTACISSYRRPDPRTAPTQAKAIGLYANIHLVLCESKQKGFDNAIMMDLDGNVCEFGTSNLIYVKNGIVYTPKRNDCYLNGITRQRVTALLADAGYSVQEKIVSMDDLMNADEVFSAGNLFKVRACRQIENREYPAPGPVATHAKKLYWDFAHGRIQSNAKIVI